jgi:HAD superfamily hydrolase (TIGR01509 family)
MPSMKSTILLDMGGVLVELGGERPFLEMIGGGIAPEEMWRRWLASPSVRAHETGYLESGAFAEEAVREFGLSVGPGEFLEHFTGWLAGPFEGAHDLLDELAARHRTAILTNLSAVHWAIAEGYGLFDKVERVFASYRVGAIKPDRDFFEIALAGLGAAPSEAVFFDDNLVNVEGARACGIEAHLVRGLQETRARLVELDLLPG